MRNVRLPLISIILVCCVFGCRSDSTSVPAGLPKTTRLRVAAAANLQFAMKDVEQRFEIIHPEIDVEFVFGASGTLFAQLVNGAPFDLYLSADRRYAERLVVEEICTEESICHFADGRIVLAMMKSSKLDVEDLQLELLEHSAINRIALANPDIAPYGRAAREALEFFSMWADVESRCVYGENISTTAQMLVSGAADAAMLAHSQASRDLRDDLSYWLIPAESHSPMEHVAVVPKSSQATDAGMAFIEFLTSHEGRALLTMHGYPLPKVAE